MHFCDMRAKLNSKYRVLSYVGLLLLGSVIPLGSVASDILMDNYTLDIRWDYLLHALVYLPLPFILVIGRLVRSRVVFGSVVLSMLIPALFEILQMAIPYRNFNINDLIANCLGVVLGWVVVVSFRSIRSFRSFRSE